MSQMSDVASEETALEEQCAETVTEPAVESKEEKKLEISEGELPQALGEEQTTAGVGERLTEDVIAGTGTGDLDKDLLKLTTVSESSVLPDSQRSGERTDEGQIVLELPYLAEAVAFLAFRKTVSELDTATKQLAGVLLGPNWLTDKKKRRELPAFVRDTFRTKSSKYSECAWSVMGNFSFLLWLEIKFDLTKFDAVQDENVAEAREKCKSCCENVKKITLLDAWKDHWPVPSPEDIASDLTRYSSVLKTLGCIDAAYTVQESASWILEKHAKLQQSLQTEGSLNTMDSVIVDRSLAEMAVVFKAYHFVEQYMYEFCRDSAKLVSHIFAVLFKKRNERSRPLGLHELFSIVGTEGGILSKAKRTLFSKISGSLTRFSKHLVEQFSGLPSLRRAVLSFWKTLDMLRSFLDWEEFRHQQRRKDISRWLDELMTNGSDQEKKEDTLLKVYYPRRHFNPRNLHHWIRPNKEKFIGRKEELSQICDSLEKQAGTVLITGPSGIGKSCLAREAAFRLRTAWPSQFVLDLSTLSSLLHSYSEMTLKNIFTTQQFQDSKNTDVINVVVENGNHRVLIIIENADSSQLMQLLKVPAQPNVSTIVIARRLEELDLFLKSREKMLSINVSLASFSPEDTLETLKQSFAFQRDKHFQSTSGRQRHAEADTGDSASASAPCHTFKSDPGQLSPRKKFPNEDASSVETFLAYVASTTKGFPVAVRLASTLLQNFPRHCFDNLQVFLEERRALPSGNDSEMTALAFTSENATAVMEMACFAISLIGPQRDLLSLLHTMSLLACPTVPMLRSLLEEVCEDIENPQGKFTLSVELENFGLLICSYDEEGEPIIHMNALISHAIQATILTPPVDRAFKFEVLREVSKSLWGHLVGEAAEELSATTRHKTACTVSRFSGNFLLSVLADEKKSTKVNRHSVHLLQSVLLAALAKFYCTGPRFSSFDLCLEHACELYMTSLGAFMHLENPESFRKVFASYKDLGLAKSRREVFSTRVIKLLLLVLANQQQNTEYLAEKDCGEIALLSAQATVVCGELPWLELYLHFAESSGCIQYHLNQSPGKSAESEKDTCRFLEENEGCDEKESPDYALGLQRRALDYQQRGEVQKAMQYFMQALPILERSNQASDIIHTLEILWDVGGATMLDQGLSSPGFSRYQLLKALGIAGKAFGKKSVHYTTALCKLAELEYELGNQTKAAEFRNLTSLGILEHALGSSEDEPSPVKFSKSPKAVKKRKKKKKKEASTE